MKYLQRISPLLLVAIALHFQGCANVLPGNDPVVVHAEQTISIATDAFDTFLLSEEQTHNALCAVSASTCAETHQYAEFLRTKVNDISPNGGATQTRRAKKWLNSAVHLKEVYQKNRTPENKRNLQTILATISAAVAESQKYLTQTNAKLKR